LSGRAKSTKRKFSIAICAAVLLGGSASFWPMVSIGIVQAQVAEKAVIKGFRSAQFGMNEADVRRAAIKDLGVKSQDILVESHPKEKTRLLSVRVKDLMPDSGVALVVYHFGFRSKTLMQVSILWGRPIDSTTTPQNLVATANVLRDFFQQQQFEREGLLLNAPTQGGIVVFRGFDAPGHMVALVLSEQAAEVAATKQGAGGEQNAPAPAKSLSLQLSYVLNPKKPDVFALEKGQF
jgi:hypothetical protein